ncbi:MAG: TetR/AcrR family transcriptional regulator [Novosphingobium sp.]
MTTAARKRHDPRRGATRVALIETAESLFAEAGPDGVSTRQIGAAIGSHNTNVVAYHFGSKEALIEAVYRHRLPEIDLRRRHLLDAAIASGEADKVETLLRIFALPLFEQTDSGGRHSYAGFLAGMERSGLIATRALVSADFPATEDLMHRIAALLPAPARLQFDLRLRLVTGMIISGLLLTDREAKGNPAKAGRIFSDALIIGAAALCAGVQGEVIEGT